MNTSSGSEPFVYEIRVEGHLPGRWSDWFEGLAIHNGPNDKMRLRGPLIDQAALFGMLGKIQALNLKLISVKRLSPPSQARDQDSESEG